MSEEKGPKQRIDRPKPVPEQQVYKPPTIQKPTSGGGTEGQKQQRYRPATPPPAKPK